MQIHELPQNNDLADSQQFAFDTGSQTQRSTLGTLKEYVSGGVSCVAGAPSGADLVSFEFEISGKRYALQFYADTGNAIAFFDVSNGWQALWTSKAVDAYAKGAALSGADIDGVTGFVTSSGTTLYISLPLILAQQVSSVNISQLNLGLRLPSGGYLGGADNYNATSYISSVTLRKTQGVVLVTVTKSDGWGIPNNSTFSGRVKLSCTFA